VIEDVILEVIVLEPGLLIDTVEVVFPGDFGGVASIQIHPDKSISVNVYVGREEIVAVESIDLSIVVFGDDELVACGVIANTVTSVGDSVLVCSKKPLPGEDRSSFKLIHILGCVPGSGQSTDRLLLILRWSSGGTKVVP
jgi:hypothetical protein